MEDAKEEEPEVISRCNFDIVNKNPRHQQSSHWRFGFLSIPYVLRDKMDNAYSDMWLSSSGTATFDLLRLNGPPYTLSQSKDDIWASFPQGIPFEKRNNLEVLSSQPILFGNCVIKAASTGKGPTTETAPLDEEGDG